MTTIISDFTKMRDTLRPGNCISIFRLWFFIVIKIDVMNTRFIVFSNYGFDSDRHPDVDKFTGADGNENFPGYDGRPPLEINGDSFELYFHSDGSGEDWGWEFTVSVQYRVLSPCASIHWLADLERCIVNMGATIAHQYLLAVPWQGDLELAVSPWLEAGFYNSDNQSDGCSGTTPILTSSGDEGEALLLDMIHRPVGSLAEKLVEKMKAKVQSDQVRDKH